MRILSLIGLLLLASLAPHFVVTIGIVIYALVFREPLEAGILALLMDAIFGVGVMPITALWFISAFAGPFIRSRIFVPDKLTA